jgi:hypothetical protein
MLLVALGSLRHKKIMPHYKPKMKLARAMCKRRRRRREQKRLPRSDKYLMYFPCFLPSLISSMERQDVYNLYNGTILFILSLGDSATSTQQQQCNVDAGENRKNNQHNFLRLIFERLQKNEYRKV